MSKYIEVTGADHEVVTRQDSRIPGWFLDAASGFEDADGDTYYGEVAGFFHTEQEAKDCAAKKGWRLIE